MAKIKLKVFNSAPGDVGQEKVIMTWVIQRLREEFNAFLELEEVDISSEADIALYILWCRLGNKSAFEEAAESYREKGIPDLLVYRKTAESPVKETTGELIEFLDKWFGNPLSGFKAAFHTFDALDEFEIRLEAHLRKLILEKLPQYNFEESPPMSWSKGSPYRGLEYFNDEYSKVFYGRTKDIGAIKDAFLFQDIKGCSFLLVLGMSGCGKSSLARAGIIPLITEKGVIEGVDLWEKAVFMPGESSKDLIHGLLKSLGEEYLALGEDFKKDIQFGINRMGDMLKIKSYKEKVKGSYTKAPEIKKFLFIDQLEDIFTNIQISEEHRKSFFTLLNVFAHSGFIWILSNMRSDFYNRIAEYPELVEMKEGKGQYDLLPPGFSEMAQIIVKPAESAGLSFEMDVEKGINLRELILEEACNNTNNLPLVQFTLNELYKRKTENNVLTFEAYRELGGLKGSIAVIAEKVLASLGEGSEQLLKKVFRELIAINPYEEHTIWAKGIREEILCNTPEKKKFVDKFVAARLLIMDKDSEGRGIVTTAHTALFTHWPRITGLIEEDREFFKLREQLLLNRNKWLENSKQKDFLIPKGKQLDYTSEILKLRREDISEELVTYIQLSIDKAKRENMKKIIGAVVVSITVVIISVFTYFQWSNQQKNKAIVKKQEAEQKLETAINQLKNIDRIGSIKNSLWVLTNNKSQKEKDILKKGEELLYNSLFLPTGVDNVKGLVTEDNNIVEFAFNNKGDEFIVSSSDGNLSLYSTKTLNKLNEKKGDTWNNISYLDEDKEIIVSSTNRISILDVNTLKQTKTMTIDKFSGFKCFGSDEKVIGFTNPEGTQIMNINLINLKEEKIVTTCKLPFDDDGNPFLISTSIQINKDYILAAYDETTKHRTAIVLFDIKTGEPLKIYYVSENFMDIRLLQGDTLRISFKDGIIADYEFSGDSLKEKVRLNCADLVKEFANGESKISMSGDFNRAAVLNKNGSFVIDINKKQLLLSQAFNGIKDLQLNDDGSHLLLLNNDNKFYILDINGEESAIRILRMINSIITDYFPKYQYSNAEECFISQINEKQLQVITDKASVGKYIKGVSSLGDINTSSSYSNNYIVSKFQNKLYIFDTNDEKNIKIMDVTEKGNFLACRNSNHGYFNTYNDEIYIIDIETGKVIKKLKANNIIAESNSGNLLVYDVNGLSTSSYNYQEKTESIICVYDFKEQKDYVVKIKFRDDDWLSKACINNKEDKLALAIQRKDNSNNFTDTVEIFDIKKGELEKRFVTKYVEGFSYISFSTDDAKLFLTTWRSVKTLFYDISSEKLIEETEEDFKHLFALNNEEGELRSDWTDKTFKISKDLYNKINSQGVVKSYFISPSQNKIAVYFEDLSLKVFNLSDRKEIVKLIKIPDSCRISFNEKEDGLRILYSDAMGVRKAEFPFLSTKEIIELGKNQLKD